MKPDFFEMQIEAEFILEDCSGSFVGDKRLDMNWILNVYEDMMRVDIVED